MTTKELIQAELDRLSEEQLDQLYRVIRRLTRAEEEAGNASLMSRLRQIRIDAPEDFASNHDRYLSGEKRAGPDLR